MYTLQETCLKPVSFPHFRFIFSRKNMNPFSPSQNLKKKKFQIFFSFSADVNRRRKRKEWLRFSQKKFCPRNDVVYWDFFSEGRQRRYSQSEYHEKTI